MTNAEILTKEWNGLDRGSDSWCQEQVRLLTDKILDTADIDGIRAVLWEMSYRNLGDAISFGGRVIEHLLKLSFVSNADAGLKKHWMHEVKTFLDCFIRIFTKGNKDLLTTYRDDLISGMWSFALKEYRKDEKDSPGFVFSYDSIPNECPYTPEDLMDLSVKELLDKMVEK